MTDEADFELVTGTGNIFKDLGDPDADLKQTKAVLAADIVSALDGCGFTVRKAGEATGFAAADFSRIRNANLGRFTIDRLMRMRTALYRAAEPLVAHQSDVPVPDLESSSPGPRSVRTPIIVDKSYAQGAHSLLDLQRDWRLLFPDAFFFEVASTDPSARHSCMSKLNDLHRAGGVHVAPNVGEMLRKEIRNLVRAGPPSANLIPGLSLDAFFLQFDELYEARGHEVTRTEADFDRDVDGLIERANTLHNSIRAVLNGSQPREGVYQDAKRTVAEDRSFISSFFADFVCRGTHAPPRASRLAEIARSGNLGPDWTIYRWVQVQLLYALDFLEKHGQLESAKLTANQRVRLQHDVIDIEYVVLGVLQGALASNDKGMRAMFRTLRPDGVVLPYSLNS
ncbi:MAG: XRE family transcriptional regulator [Gammaproteobacteria bacterium]|nr:XRE family transcriptional regulator [Gammaproteobacteria bacterium]MYB40076.1 XRE family transcriptional regulator [Candidatus Saccharibacteria bacterium]MYF51084.1 XRE family transcriptional regulator [Gammaproteobacteria bacterium]